MRLRRDRLLVGLRGLTLLRGWPFEQPEGADAQLDAVRDLMLASEDPSSVIEVDDLEVHDAYASWAQTYDGPNPLFTAEEPAVRSFLDGIEPGRALDVACGTGRLAQILTERAHRVIALDASIEMLARVPSNAPGASLACADLRRLPLRTSSLDLVVCGLALTHVPALREPIVEFSRVMRAGARLIVSDIHPVAAATGAHAFFVREDGSRGVTRNEVHWPSAYVDAFRSAGLAIEQAAEPRFDARFVEEMPEAAIRNAARESLVGLPFALVWRVRKEG
jgi:ubiquinone/menaquinone biosynthesis C-methylase UbiE